VTYGHSGPGFAESAGFFLRQFPALHGVAMVVLAPRRIAPADGAPCTIFAFSRADLNWDNVPER
jgi:hypothetical protein